MKSTFTQDEREAVSWYQKAAEQGLAEAQTNLGVMYDNDNGEGVTQDKHKAASWYQKAAKQGDASAQTNLGLMYDNGEGVITDEREAYIWWSIAQVNGNESATTALRKTKWQQHLTSTEIKTARREAAKRLEAIDQRTK